MIPVKPVIEADLLIVGGGIGGLMAGIAAGKAGCKNVVIMESLQLLYPFLSRRRHRARIQGNHAEPRGPAQGTEPHAQISGKEL